MKIRAAATSGALALAGLLLAACSQVQQEAEDEAARVADHVLPDAVAGAVSASGARTAEERVAAAQTWLATPDPAVSDSQRGATWVVTGLEATTIRVAVYTRWESGSLFPPDQGESAWGVACRSYDVAAGVAVRPVDCPDGTPASP